MSDRRSNKKLVDNGQWFLSWQIFLVTTSRLSNVFVLRSAGEYSMTSGYISSKGNRVELPVRALIAQRLSK